MYNGHMRKIFLCFLTIVMLMPSLACAMPVCGPQAQAEAAKKQPCAEHCTDCAGHAHKDQKKSGKPMLMKDCMGLEFQVTDNGPSIHKPDVTKDAPAILAAHVLPVMIWTPGDAVEIRGPPPEWPALSQIQPSIILTTQRFRV